MKKIFILVISLVAYSNILLAFTTQRHWRWRNDDGSQTTATWKAAENTPAALTSSSEIFRLRIEVYNNTTDPVLLEDSLQWATATTGPWTNIDTLPGTNPFMIAKTSAFVVQDEPTTSQLADIALTFVPGKVMVDSPFLHLQLPNQETTELE